MSKKTYENKPLELYTDEQREAIEKHIEKYFGEIITVFSEKVPEYVKLSVNVIPPSRKQPYYTLVTCGMGAHIMNVPSELKDKHLERAEFVICLPPNWDINSEEFKYYWPLKILSLLAKLPIEEDSWISWGHSVDYGTDLSDDVGFCGIMIIDPEFEEDSCVCSLDDDNKVNFYQVLPLYRSELEFKHNNGASALIKQFPDKYRKIADIERPCVVPDNFMEIIDTVERHSKKIVEKNLDVLEINGANHISAFLLWLIEYDMVNDDFLEFFADEIQQIQAGKYDVRKFLINSLGGELTTDILNEEGREFVQSYYDFYCEPPSYPSDVDKMAEAYFGKERYESDEFSNEAYLFVPFDKIYIISMQKYITTAFGEFCTMKDLKLSDEKWRIDSYDDHVCKIRRKKLDTPEINAVNHITAFLRWSIEHKLMHGDFIEFYAEYKDMIESGELELRDFIINNLNGEISIDMFNEEGQAFCKYYYIFSNGEDKPCYPSDVDRMTLDYFGEGKYNCEEFQDEAYLFVPFNKTYYRNISKYINKNYRNFKKIYKK